MPNGKPDYDGIKTIFFAKCKLKSNLVRKDISSMMHKLIVALGLRAGRVEPMFYEYGKGEHLGTLAVMPLVESHMLFQNSMDVKILEIEIAHTDNLQLSEAENIISMFDEISSVEGTWLHRM